MHFVHAVSGQPISYLTLRNAREGNHMTHTHALCLVDHDPRPRQAAPGSTVCHGCRLHALDATAQMPALWHHLENYLDTRNSSSPLTGMPTGTPDPGISINHAVARTRANIRIHLECWTRIGIDEGPWHTQPPATLTAMAHWIATRIDWYTNQDWSDEFITQTLELRAEGRRHRQPNKAATFTVGPCPEPDCTGTLITRLRPADSLLPSVIWCDTAPVDEETGEQLHVWPAGDGWHQLGRKIHKRSIQ